MANSGISPTTGISTNTGISSGFSGISGGPGTSGSAPGGGNHILTEASDFLNTESSNRLITET